MRSDLYTSPLDLLSVDLLYLAMQIETKLVHL